MAGLLHQVFSSPLSEALETQSPVAVYNERHRPPAQRCAVQAQALSRSLLGHPPVLSSLDQARGLVFKLKNDLVLAHLT